MALFRALESCRPPEQRLFGDPLAPHCLSAPLRIMVHVARLAPLGQLIARCIDHRWPGARTSAVARTRLIDDEILASLRRGIAQIVLLGSGFDARAWRLPGMERARVFEVDRRATMAAKREIVRRHARDAGDHVTFVELDLAGDDVQQALLSAGFRPEVPSFFLWEGVTNYLTAKAVDSTVRFVASLAAAGSSLLFTYVHRGIIDGSFACGSTGHLFATLHDVREPWTFGFDPAELADFLAARGFTLIADQGARDYRAAYMGVPGEGYEFYRAALARRTAAASAPADSKTGTSCRG